MANLKNVKKPRATSLAHTTTPDHKEGHDSIPKLSIDLAQAKTLNPYVEHVAKRLRALRKRMQKIEKMEEKVKSLSPHEINDEQKAVLAKKPELLITMKELCEIFDNLVHISQNPPVEEKQDEPHQTTDAPEQAEVEEKPEEAQVEPEPQNDVEPEAEAPAESEPITTEEVSENKDYDNPDLFQALNFFSSLLSTYFNKALPISQSDYQSLELFRSVVLSGEFEKLEGRQIVVDHLRKLSSKSEDNVSEEYPVTYEQVHKIVSSITASNNMPPEGNGEHQEHQYQFEADQQSTQSAEKEIQVYSTVSRPPGGFNFMTASEILDNTQQSEEPQQSAPTEDINTQEIHTAFPEPQQFNNDVSYNNDQWNQYQDQNNFTQDTYQQFPSADNSSEVPLGSQPGFENPLSVLMNQPVSDPYATQQAHSNDLPPQNEQDNATFNDGQRNWSRRPNRDYRRNNASYGGKSDYRNYNQYDNHYDSNGNIGANNQYRPNSDKYRNRSNWNQNQSPPNAGGHPKSNPNHYNYNGNQNNFRNPRNHNSRAYGGGYRGPRDGYDGMIPQNPTSGYQH